MYEIEKTRAYKFLSLQHKQNTEYVISNRRERS